VSRTEGLTEQDGPVVHPVAIEVVAGPHRPPALTATVGTYVVGSQPGCDLVLEDPSVSRRHARLELLGNSIRVVDLGSRNGTRYLGAKIGEALVPLGGEVQLGRSTLRFVALEPDDAKRLERLGPLVGRSAVMQTLYRQVEQLAPSNLVVLLLGETGTGKGAVAQALHQQSPRSRRPFVVFDCGATNPNLIEAALFGYAKGAFTDARDNRAGAFEQALEGTLFLDEIGELPLELQPKLLRALDSHDFCRLGDGLRRRITCRFVAATHRDLEAMVAAGRFRADLYFRLAQAVVTVPPLRARREDVPLLVEELIRRKTNASARLSAATMASLQAERWPGNVRELSNAVERALTLGDFRATASAVSTSFAQARSEVVDAFEREYLRALIEETGGNLSEVARRANVARSQLYRLLEKHGLKGE
jgi:DNA-binding NtrC family response regulator